MLFSHSREHFQRYFTMSIKILVILFIIKLYGQNNIFKKIRLISKLLTSKPGKQTVASHVLPYISRSTSNQTLKFGQLIECNMRNICLKKLLTKYSEKLI